MNVTHGIPILKDTGTNMLSSFKTVRSERHRPGPWPWSNLVDTAEVVNVAKDCFSAVHPARCDVRHLSHGDEGDFSLSTVTLVPGESQPVRKEEACSHLVEMGCAVRMWGDRVLWGLPDHPQCR